MFWACKMMLLGVLLAMDEGWMLTGKATRAEPVSDKFGRSTARLGMPCGRLLNMLGVVRVIMGVVRGSVLMALGNMGAFGGGGGSLVIIVGRAESFMTGGVVGLSSATTSIRDGEEGLYNIIMIKYK
jgi:hypothetical protein